LKLYPILHLDLKTHKRKDVEMPNVDLVAINNRKVPLDEKAKEKLNNDPEFYLTASKKLVNSIAPRFKTGLAQEILKSEDALGNIATQLMFADWRWDGTGTIEGYRKQCAIWAIQGYLSRDVNFNKKHNMMSLNFNIDDEGHELTEVISDSGSHDPSYIASEKEEEQKQQFLIDTLLSSGVLTEPQEECVRMYYLQEMSLTNIAKELKISREAVRQLVDRGINRLRNLNNEE